MIDASAHNAKRENRCLHLEGIVCREREDRAPQRRAVTVAETPHHAEIEPYNRAASNANVAGMWVAVKEPVLDDLLRVVFSEPSPNLRDVHARCMQSIGLIE